MVRITRRKRWSSKLPLSSRPTMIFPAPAQVRSAASIAIAVLLCAGSTGAEVRHTVLNRRIEAGQTLGGALNAAGIPDAQRESILGALGGVLDFRRCQIGDQFRIALEDDQVQGFDYRQNSRDEWQVRREGSRYLASRRKIEIEKRIETVELQIDSSLYQAALAAGEDPALPLSISDVFAWDIDFYQDVRKGDRVRAVIEKFVSKGRLLRYGEIFAAVYEGQSVGRKRSSATSFPMARSPIFRRTENRRARRFCEARSNTRTSLRASEAVSTRCSSTSGITTGWITA